MQFDTSGICSLEIWRYLKICTTLDYLTLSQCSVLLLHLGLMELRSFWHNVYSWIHSQNELSTELWILSERRLHNLFDNDVAVNTFLIWKTTRRVESNQIDSQRRQVLIEIEYYVKTFATKSLSQKWSALESFEYFSELFWCRNMHQGSDRVEAYILLSRFNACLCTWVKMQIDK